MSVFDRRTFVAGSTALFALQTFPARAAGHEVQMLNKHPEDKKQLMAYFPRILVVQPGDTVKFVPVDKGHNSESIDGMIPDGAEAWTGKISKEIEVTSIRPGYYGYRCKPHFATGMVGLIICEGEGKLDNLEAAKSVKLRGRAGKVFGQIWSEAEAAGLLA